MADNPIVTVKDPSGELGTITRADLPKALQHGYTIPDNSEIQTHNNKIEYGGFANTLKAAGEAAAGTATFGLSRELENASGLTTPEAQAGRASVHPVAKTIGELGGIFTPLGIEGAVGKEALGAGKYLNPVGRVAEIGRGAGELAGGLASEGSLAQKALSSSAQGAAEGVFYGAGQSVQEHALGDPDLNGEKVLHNIGYGALLGGQIGAALGTAEHVVPKAVGGARDALIKAKQSLLGGGEGEAGLLENAYAKASSFVSGRPEESILEGLKQRASIIEDPAEREAMASKFAGNIDEHFQKINEALRSANSEGRQEEINNLLSQVTSAQAKQQSAHVWESVDNTLKEMTEHAPLYPASVPYKLQGIRDEFIKMAGGAENAAEVYNSVNWLKKKIDEKFPIWGKNVPPEWKDAVDALRGIRSEVKQNLENESIWGEAAARQSAFNDAQNRFLTVVNNKNSFSKAFLGKNVSRTGQIVAKVDPSKVKTFLSQLNTLRSEAKAAAFDDFVDASHNLIGELENTYKNAPLKSFNKDGLSSLVDKNKAYASKVQEQTALQKNLGMLGAGAHNTYLGEAGALMAGFHNPLLGAAIEGINMLRNPGLAIQRLAKIESVINKTTKAIEKAASSIFSVSSKAGKMTSGYVGAKLASENHEKREESISKFLNNPEGSANRLGTATAGMYQAAPNITASVHQTTARASQFLASKLPQRKTGLFGDKSPISQAEINNFNQYYNTVENPLGVMGNIKDGSIVPQQMETLAVVYPKLLEEMRSHVLESIMNHKEVVGSPVPYKTKLGLSYFLGQATDESMSPIAIQSNQLTFAANPGNQGLLAPQGGKTTLGGLKELNSADRAGLSHESNLS